MWKDKENEEMIGVSKMNWFKRCDHEYKLYYKEKVYESGRSTPDYNFLFVCSKCKKEMSVKDQEIFDIYKDFEKEEARDSALGLSHFPKIALTVPMALRFGDCNRLLHRHAAYRTKEYFLSKGIDITELERN